MESHEKQNERTDEKPKAQKIKSGVGGRFN
jgi:hypothetical protein